jgi:hypothetical protein
MFCTNCGTSNKDDERLCINCGEPLAETEIKKRPFNERMLEKAHFLQVLFDFSFNQFVTLKITKSLYVLSILYAGLLAVLCLVIGLSISRVLGIFMLLIGSPLVFLLTLVYSRILLETAIVVSRIAKYVAEIAKKADSKDGIQWNI